MPNRNRSKSKNTDSGSPQEAYRAALLLLNRRDYTAQRLATLLTNKGFDDQACQAAVTQLQTEGWLDDRRFAERFAESATASGRYFGQRLRQEMVRRGFSAEVTGEVLGTLTDKTSERDDARRLIEQRFGNFCYAQSDDREKRRVFGYLQRKGLSFSAIMHAMKENHYIS